MAVFRILKERMAGTELYNPATESVSKRGIWVARLLLSLIRKINRRPSGKTGPAPKSDPED